MGSPGGTHKLQLLAEALASGFAQSQASPRTAAALARVLPGLRYLSIAVANPAHLGVLVASSNHAAEGHTTLHLHDPLRSAAGRAMALNKPLQTSLLNGAGQAVLPAWTDVELMVASAPSVTHLLCIPFGCDGGDGAAELSSSSGMCQQHGGQGSGRGALLFGFSAAPELDARRKAVLGVLSQCLPAPMARLSGDTLAFVNFACGNGAQCSCCCGADEEDEEEEEAVPASPCCDDDHGAGGGGGAAPGQAIRVPRSEAANGDAGSSRGAGPSSDYGPLGPGKDAKRSLSLRKGASAAAAAAGLEPPAPRRGSRASALLNGSMHGPPAGRFSKALLASVEEHGEGLLQQSHLTLSFRAPAVEAEYGRWISRYHVKVDVLFSLLLMAALSILSFIKPYRLIVHGPLYLALGACMAVPLVANWASSGFYAAWRERLVILLRLYVLAFINLVSIRTYQGLLPHHRLQQWITFWMLTGAESLAVTAIGFPIRQHLHLPLQLAALGVAAWSIPQMCSECYPGVHPGTCFKSGTAMLALFGYVLPTVGLRYIEQRSRAAFANALRAAAAHQG